MKKQYTLRLADLFDVTFEVDHDIMTDAKFTEVYNCQTNSPIHLHNAGGDVIKATLIFYAREFFECTVKIDPVEYFNCEAQGFYNLKESSGITVVKYDEVNLWDFDIEFVEGKDE